MCSSHTHADLQSFGRVSSSGARGKAKKTPGTSFHLAVSNVQQQKVRSNTNACTRVHRSAWCTNIPCLPLLCAEREYSRFAVKVPFCKIPMGADSHPPKVEAHFFLLLSFDAFVCACLIA